MASCAQGQDYPPWLRIIDLAYDYDNGRARLAIKEGYEKGKTYIRRYDQVRSSGRHQHTAEALTLAITLSRIAST